MKERITLIPARVKDKWGYIDKKGTWVIAPRFDAAWEPDALGIARVAIRGGIRLIDAQGRYLTGRSYHAMSLFHPTHRVARAEKDERWALIGADGVPLTKFEYDSIRLPSSGGLIAVQKNGWWGYIDCTGQTVIRPQFFAVQTFNGTGCAAVKAGKRWHLIDTAGKSVTRPIFDNVCEFSVHDVAAVLVDGRWGYINGKGDYIVEPHLKRADSFGDADIATVRDGEDVFTIDITGKTVFGPVPPYRSYDHRNAARLGFLFAIDSFERYGAVSMTGEELCPPRFDGYEVLEVEGEVVILVKEKGAWGIVNKRLEYLIEPSYKSIYPAHYGLIAERSSGFAYIDRWGHMVADDVRSYKYSEGRLLVRPLAEWLCVAPDGSLTPARSPALPREYPSWVPAEVDEIHLPHGKQDDDSRELYSSPYDDDDIVRGYRYFGL